MDRNSESDEPDLRPRRNFSVRLPEELYARLDALAQKNGESMNKLVGTAVALLVESPDLAPTAVASDIHPRIARDAIRQGPEAIGPLKGIAKHASNRNQMVLACVLWAAAARIVAADTEGGGPEAASRELAHSAARVEKTHPELAVALYEEALQFDRNNLDAASRLGQRLHHLASLGGDIERYREAERHLSRVTFLDNHAKLFHGWSALHVARADGDCIAEERAVSEIGEALKGWAFGTRDGSERLSWLKQIQRLRNAGLSDEAQVLVDFANRNARWEPISS